MPRDDAAVTSGPHRAGHWTASRWTWVWLVALLEAMLVTWPVAGHLASHVSRGRQSCGTVAFFNLWTLGWNRDRLQHGLARYWDAPIFFPSRGTFALSEPEPLLGLAFTPLSAVLGDVVAYNAVLLLVLTLNGVCAVWMLRRMALDPWPATLGGLLAVALPYPLQELGVLQLTVLFPFFVALGELAGLEHISGLTGRGAVRIALAWGLSLYTCLYHTAFLSVLLALAFAMLVLRPPWRRQSTSNAPAAERLAADHREPNIPARSGSRWGLLPGCLGAAFVMGLLLLPFALGPYGELSGHERSARDVRIGSASAYSYTRLEQRSPGGMHNPLLKGRPRGYALYPGTCLLLLALLGAVTEWRGPRARFVHFLASGVLLALLLSFGNRLSLGGFTPYDRLVRAFVPGFAQLRSPYRFTVVVQVLLVALAGLGLARALHWLAGRLGHGRAIVAACTALGLGAIEAVPLGQHMYPVPIEAGRKPWVSWLAGAPDGAVAMLPVAETFAMADYEPTVVAMLQGLVHRHPLVNGYSGFFPATHDRFMRGLKVFPRRRALTALRASGARYAVVKRAWLENKPGVDPNRVPGLQLVYRDKDSFIYERADPRRTDSNHAP